jgi:threonine-phosphate decarboxylase
MRYKVKSTLNLVRDSFKNLKPCAHGADVFDAATKSGYKRADIIDFSSSVTPIGPSQKAIEAIKRDLNEISAYPDSESTTLRNALACHYGNINQENIVVGNGSTELIYLFAEAFTQKGDLVLLPAPSFGEYEGAVKKAGATVMHVSLDSNLHFVPANFINSMNENVKAVFLCNPNNPTSALSSTQNIEEIIEAALNRSIMVFLDEDFLEFIDNDAAYSFIVKINKYPNLFILRSFTKLYGLTGLRVGYGIACEEVIKVLSNAKIPWNVNCLGQTAAVAALEDKTHLKTTLDLIKQEKEFLLSELSQFKTLKIYPPDANFMLIDIRQTGFTAAELKTKLLTFGILIRDCSSFAGLDEYYIRIAVKTHLENEKLLDALKKTL